MMPRDKSDLDRENWSLLLLLLLLLLSRGRRNFSFPFSFFGERRGLWSMMASTSWGRGEFLRGVNIHTRSQDWENKVRVCIFSFFFFFPPSSPWSSDRTWKRRFFRNWKYTRRFGINKKSVQIVTRFHHVSISHLSNGRREKSSKNGLIRHFLTLREMNCSMEEIDWFFAARNNFRNSPQKIRKKGILTFLTFTPAHMISRVLMREGNSIYSPSAFCQYLTLWIMEWGREKEGKCMGN